jgi:hypothetical protein
VPQLCDANAVGFGAQKMRAQCGIGKQLRGRFDYLPEKGLFLNWYNYCEV